MWIRREELEGLIEKKVRDLTEKELRVTVRELTKEWETKRKNLIEEVEVLKMQIPKHQKVREELLKFNAPIEVILKQVDWYRDVVYDTRNEARDQIRTYLGKSDVPEAYPYETEPLESGVTYKVGKDSFIGVVGIKFLEGAGYFEEKYMEFKGIKFTVNTKETYKIFDRGRVLASEIEFIIKPLTKESKLKYTLIGTGFNNPKIEEVE